MFWFIVLLLVAGAGFYFYQKLMAIEREIRADQEAELLRDSAPGSDSPIVEEKPVAVETENEPTVAETPVMDRSMTLEDELLAAVKNLPGIKQTEVYSSFPDVDRKKLQQLLKEFEEKGLLRREKKGSSYSLFPA